MTRTPDTGQYRIIYVIVNWSIYINVNRFYIAYSIIERIFNSTCFYFIFHINLHVGLPYFIHREPKMKVSQKMICYRNIDLTDYPCSTNNLHNLKGLYNT